MIMVLVVTICAKSIFLVIARVAGNPLVGMYGLHMSANGLFVRDGGVGTVERVGSMRSGSHVDQRQTRPVVAELSDCTKDGRGEEWGGQSHQKESDRDEVTL